MNLPTPNKDIFNDSSGDAFLFYQPIGAPKNMNSAFPNQEYWIPTEKPSLYFPLSHSKPETYHYHKFE